MSRVPVQPKVLRWARKRAGLEVSDLTKPFPRWEEWENGNAAPTFKQLERIARRTRTPFGFFFLTDPPEDRLPIPDFRTVGDEKLPRPSPDLLETVQIMQRRQAWMREFLQEEGESPLSLVGCATMDAEPSQIAGAMRDVLKINQEWVRAQPTWTDALVELRRQCDNEGVLIVINGVVENNPHRKLRVEEFRGFTLCDEYAPLIFINGTDAKAAQMFTLAHELAHLWIGRDGVFNFDRLEPQSNEVERFCNAVAAEFLVPGVEMRQRWAEALEAENPYQWLAARFKVSPLVAARRAQDLDLIDQEEFLDFYRHYQEELQRRGEKGGGKGNFWNNQNVRLGHRFGAAVVRAAKEGRLLYHEAYQLTGLRGSTFHRFAEKQGIQL